MRFYSFVSSRLPLIPFAFLPLIFSLPPAVAQTRPASSTSPTLSGMITNQKGQPVAGATVLIYTAEPRAGTSPYCPSCYADCSKHGATDATGNFRIPSLNPELIFSILVVREGYEPRFVSHVDPGHGPLLVSLKNLSIQDSQSHNLVRGRVVDPQGKPVLGAIVSPTRAIPLEGTLDSVSVEPLAITDVRGEFRFHGVPRAVTYNVRVEARGFAPQVVQDLDVGKPAKTITLSVGTLVVGSVRDEKGRGLAGATVQLVPTQQDSETFVGRFETGTDANGYYRFYNVTSGGDYLILVRMDGLANSNQAVPTQTIHLPSTKLLVELPPLKTQTGVLVSGQVELSDGKPIPDGTRVMLGRDDTWDVQEEIIKDDGRFTFAGIPKGGNFQLSLNVPGYHMATPEHLSIKASSIDDLTLRLIKNVSVPLPIAVTTSPLVPERTAENETPIDLDKIEVKLLGIGAPIDGQMRWWDAQGNVLEPVPPILAQWKMSGNASEDRERSRTIAFQVQNRDAGSAGVALRTLDDSYFNWRDDSDNKALGKQLTLTRAYIVPTANLKSNDLMVGVALGAWKTVSRIGTADWPKSFQTQFILEEHPQVIFPDATNQLRMQSLMPDNQALNFTSRRIVAVNNAGEEFPLQQTGSVAEGSPIIMFPNPRQSSQIMPDEIKEFRLQTRPFHWTLFSNVAFVPKQ